jgi:hypothetical protein
MVTPATFDQLVNSQGQQALSIAMGMAPAETSRLTALATLRKQFSAELAAAALETVLLRTRAKAKFANADRMYFTREALEQSTGEAVAQYRASRFAKFARVLDLGCGIGGDAIALASAGCQVTAIDRDPVRLALCRENLAAHSLNGTCLVADVLKDPLPEADAAFCDPARRAGGRRVLSPDESDPPPRAVMARFPAGFPIGFKLAPGIDPEEAAALGGEVEFISLDGELKECCVWLGELRTTARRATVLRVVRSLRERETLASESPAPWPEVTDIGEYLYDPDSTIVRAGLVGDLAKATGLTSVDYRVAFLTGGWVETPFATRYRVREVCSLDAKTVATKLRTSGVGRVTIIKRGVEADADKLNAKWTSDLPVHRFVILTRIGGSAKAVIAERK